MSMIKPPIVYLLWFLTKIELIEDDISVMTVAKSRTEYFKLCNEFDSKYRLKHNA